MKTLFDLFAVDLAEAGVVPFLEEEADPLPMPLGRREESFTPGPLFFTWVGVLSEGALRAASQMKLGANLDEKPHFWVIII